MKRVIVMLRGRKAKRHSRSTIENKNKRRWTDYERKRHYERPHAYCFRLFSYQMRTDEGELRAL